MRRPLLGESFFRLLFEEVFRRAEDGDFFEPDDWLLCGTEREEPAFDGWRPAFWLAVPEPEDFVLLGES